MIAADSSSLINFFRKENTPDALQVEKAIADNALYLPPPVVTELLSNPKLQPHNREIILVTEMLKTDDKLWHRSGDLRAKVIAKGRKAKLGDALIAQVCIDHDVPLITADMDFENFVPLGLKLAK